MKYIVYVTSGEYSDFLISNIMVGEVDPDVVLDELVDKMSKGRWKSFDKMRPEAPYRTAQRLMEMNLIRDIRLKAAQTLRDSGFVENEAKEVWLG